MAGLGSRIPHQDKPAGEFHVVGHTDNTGSLAHDMELSKRRAEAIVRWLASRSGITSERLRAECVGPVAPVASNRTEAGKAKNRRVELVKE